jgi:hypothetical protein
MKVSNTAGICPAVVYLTVPFYLYQFGSNLWGTAYIQIQELIIRCLILHQYDIAYLLTPLFLCIIPISIFYQQVF